MWGRDSYAFEDVDVAEERVTKIYERLTNATEHTNEEANKVLSC